jgi:flagellar hook-associated protein 2
MGSVITSGVGSGLDIQGLVSQLVAAEGAPQTLRLNRQEAALQGKLSALGTLRSALAEFQSALDSLNDLETFRGRSVTQSNADFVSVAASSSAAPGRFSLEVEQLASSQRLASAAFVNQDSVVGTGTLSIAVGGASFAVTIDADNNTLAGIREAINGAAENTGVVANIINAVDGSRLVLSATETGLANTLTVTEADGDGGLVSLVYDPDNLITNLTEIDPAQDARVLVEGFAVEATSNTVSGAIDGLDIVLLAQNAPGDETDVTVGFDRDGARSSIEALVDSYNSLVDAVDSLTSFDPETETAGPLLGDATVRNLTSQLRRELGVSVSGLQGPFASLIDLGVTAELDGKLSIDGAKLDGAFDQDFDAIGNLFTAPESGVAARLDALVDPYLSTGGLLDTRTDGLNLSIEDIGDRRQSLDERLAAVETRLFDQFNALDSLLAQLQSTSNFLAQQLANLPGTVVFDRNNT